MKTIQELADKARTSISHYCIHECKAYCCRKGSIMLSKKEAQSITELDSPRLKQIGNENFAFELEGGCPKLDENNMCTIHTEPQRPRTCGEYPVFIKEGKQILLSYRCPAVRERKLYAFEREILTLGWSISAQEGAE